MTAEEGTVWIHVESDRVGVYRLTDGMICQLGERAASFDSDQGPSALVDQLSEAAEWWQGVVEDVASRRVRVLATGAFQRLAQADADVVVNGFYVDTGLYLNIVSAELEEFYRRSDAEGPGSLLKGVVRQEFRKVVVCGSFQQSLSEIEQVISKLRAAGTTILSPASTRIKPETATTDFVLFEYQDFLKNERDTWRHKYDHMDKFRQADAVVVCDPGGVVGNGTLFELGFMSASSRRVIFTEPPLGISVLFPFEVGL